MSRVSLVAKRYAKALFNSVQNRETMLRDLRIIVKLLMDQDIKAFFTSRLQSDVQKTEVLTLALSNKGLSQELFNFMMILAERGRIEHLPDILLSYESLVDQQNGVIRGVVRSAIQLDTDARLRIEGVVSHFIKKKVILTYSENSSLVGGVMAQINGWTFEDTLESHLKRLKEDLNRRTN